MSDVEHLDTMMDIEMGGFDIDNDRHIETLQALIDSGVVWKLQGWWGRLAQAAINAKVCTIK